MEIHPLRFKNDRETHLLWEQCKASGLLFFSEYQENFNFYFKIVQKYTSTFNPHFQF